MRRHLGNEDLFACISRKHVTSDSLLPSSCMRVLRADGGYDLVFEENPQISIFPSPNFHQIVDLLVDDVSAWDALSFRATCSPSIHGSAPVFGVPFSKAVEIAIKHGFAKSKFFFAGGGFDAAL
jgi:hypothetical protein